MAAGEIYIIWCLDCTECVFKISCKILNYLLYFCSVHSVRVTWFFTNTALFMINKTILLIINSAVLVKNYLSNHSYLMLKKVTVLAEKSGFLISLFVFCIFTGNEGNSAEGLAMFRLYCVWRLWAKEWWSTTYSLWWLWHILPHILHGSPIRLCASW